MTDYSKAQSAKTEAPEKIKFITIPTRAHKQLSNGNILNFNAYAQFQSAMTKVW